MLPQARLVSGSGIRMEQAAPHTSCKEIATTTLQQRIGLCYNLNNPQRKARPR